jgi:hypothetical protein
MRTPGILALLGTCLSGLSPGCASPKRDAVPGVGATGGALPPTSTRLQTPRADAMAPAPRGHLDASVVPPGIVCDSPRRAQPPACGAACGNGKVDTCGAALGGDPYVAREECDGTLLGSATCVSLGFRGGNLACGATCWFDTRQCDPCAPGPHLMDCRAASIDASSALDLALAAREGAVFVAWTECGLASAGVHVARVDAGLQLISDTVVDAVPARSVQIASSGPGFVLAYAVPEGIKVQALDAQASPNGPPRVIAGATNPLLVPRSMTEARHEGPLLAWDEYDPDDVSRPPVPRVKAAMLHEDGTQATLPVTVFDAARANVRADPGSGIDTGEGFLLARTGASRLPPWESRRQRAAGTHVAAIRPDGQARDHGTVGAPDATDPRLVAMGRDAVLLQVDPKSGLTRMRVDARGGPAGPPDVMVPTAAGRPWELGVPGAAIGFGSDVLLSFLRGAGGGVSLLRAGRRRDAVAAPYAIAHDLVDASRAGQPALVRAGDDVIAAWVGGGQEPGRIQLARVKP